VIEAATVLGMCFNNPAASYQTLAALGVAAAARILDVLVPSSDGEWVGERGSKGLDPALAPRVEDETQDQQPSLPLTSD